MAGLLLSVSASADFKRDYGSAVRKYDGGKYADAIKGFQKAIEQEPSEQEKVRIYGMRYEPYMPYFFLGQAKFKNGDCEGALAAWQESISQGVIAQQQQFDEMQTNMAACGSLKVDVTQIAQDAENALRTLKGNINSFAQLGNEKILSGEWTTRWAPELNRARSTAQTLQQRLVTAVEDTDEAAINAIITETLSTADVIKGSQGMAIARVGSLRESQAENELKRRNDARSALTQAVNNGKSVKFQQGSAQMTSLQKQLEALLAKGTNAAGNSSTSSQEYGELAQSINNVGRRYASAAQDWQAEQRNAQAAAEDAAAAKAAAERRIPPRVLKQIAVAYFAGNYQGAIDLADPGALDENRAKVQALLFRAAASYKLYVLSGEEDKQALQRTEEDIRAIKQVNARFSPYIAAFSPKFLALFDQSG